MNYLGNGAQYEGYAATLGVDVPVLGGTAKAMVAYSQAENVEDSEEDNTRYGVGLGYTYAFSKRTNVYTGLTYMADDYGNRTDGEKPSTTEFMLGLKHTF